jgi:flagellar basal body rod protein FlgG
MFFDASLSGALDRIAARAADVRRAYTPGAIPQYDDVATTASVSDFTLDPLAVVAPDGAYFIARDGRGRDIYTRDGLFALRGGTLVDADGRSILGARDGKGPLRTLCVDPIDAALGRVRDVAIDRNGALSYRRETIDPRSGERTLQRLSVGRIALARFPAGTRLETTDGSHMVPPAGTTLQTGFAEDGSFAALLPMQRERSRVDIDESLIRLKDAYLTFDALQAAQAAKGRLSKTAMDLLK